MTTPSPSGLVIVDKPAGLTSHDVVDRIRRLAGTRKVGHAGTLDPMATGVLVVGIEKATRLLGYLTLTEKEYRATIRLGVSTSTDDAEGEVTGGAACLASDEEIRAVVKALTGEIAQVPPQVSAIKVNGQRAYKLTRAGAAPELAARQVTVHEFSITAIRRDGDRTDLDAIIRCSSGTYIRSLARDLGTALGTGGHLVALRRTKVGPYGEAQARSLDMLAERLVVQPLETAAAQAFPRRDLSTDEARSLSHGGRLAGTGVAGPVAAFAPDGALVALIEEDQSRARPLVVFALGLVPTVLHDTDDRGRTVYRWRGVADVPPDWGDCVATIGVFDGVHRGHQRIIGRALDLGRERGLPVVVITFDPHPDEVVQPGSHPPFLTTLRRRGELLAGLGAEAMVVLPFDLEFSRLTPDEFVRVVLSERLHAAAAVVGENFRFGHKATGDVPLLAKLGEKYDFTAEGVPLLAGDGATISSTYIRERLAAGDVAAAADALGRPHRVEGVVVRGHQRGRALGFPTANLESPPHTAIPADGVYAGWLLTMDLDGTQIERWPAAISVGTNPTFGAGERTVEAYALDRDDLDLYGAHAAIEFTARLRGTVRFDSVADLVVQMHSDVDQARVLTGG